MESSRTTFVPEVDPPVASSPPGDLSLVEIAERLERVTQAIEAQRNLEREARRVYQEVAARVEARIAAIRADARALVDEQRRRMASFDGMIADRNSKAIETREPKPLRSFADRAADESTTDGRSSRLNIQDAVLRVWTLERYRMPLTTTEISRAIRDVGYVTRAAPRSMKSTLNQALAKLCRDRLVRRFRTDGTEIDPADHHSRARKYMAIESAIEQNASLAEHAA